MELLDTFPEFERFWKAAASLPLDRQIERWKSDYMARWPELLRKQLENYRRSGVSWRTIARTQIFPQLPRRLARLRRLRQNLLRRLPGAWAKTRRVLNVDFEVQFVIYVGLGCGAGWATHLGGKPAVLFGLENAAEMSSGRRGEWPGSVSHEVAHLVHDEWRRRRGLGRIEGSRGPYWQLYEEGFATECERNIEAPRVFRLRTGRADWLPWCERHRTELAQAFLRDVRLHRSVRKFFGSWYNIRGQVECGYYLGAEAVRTLRQKSSLQAIAWLSEREARRRTRDVLASIAVS